MSALASMERSVIGCRNDLVAFRVGPARGCARIDKMARRIGGAAVLARVALATVLLSGCAQAQYESGQPTSIDTLPPATAPPATSTPTGKHVTIRWELDAEFRAAELRGIVRGTDGLVAFGGCDHDHGFTCPTAWFSSDGRAWSGREVPHEWPCVELHAAAAGATGYLIAGSESNQNCSSLPEEQDGTRIWGSPDGRRWDLLGVVRLDKCCPSLLALAPTGRIIVGAHDSEWPSIDLLSSEEGRQWDALEPSDFGVEALNVYSLESTPTEVVLIGSACPRCEVQMWTSTDGIAWSSAGTFPTPVSSVIADGQVRVVHSTRQDPGDSLPTTEFHASVDGGVWRVVQEVRDLQATRVTFTGSMFVAVGFGWYRGHVVLASPDGFAWTQVPIDGLPEAFDDECEYGWLTGWGETLLMGQKLCGTWRGTQAFAPGPAPAPVSLPPEPTPRPTEFYAPGELVEGLEASVRLIDSCRSAPDRAHVTFELSWTGDVPIDRFDTGIDGEFGSSSGFPATTSHSDTFGEEAWADEPQVLGVRFWGPRMPGAILKELELPFIAEPVELCPWADVD
jgi:hypothetical protein